MEIRKSDKIAFLVTVTLLPMIVWALSSWQSATLIANYGDGSRPEKSLPIPRSAAFQRAYDAVARRPDGVDCGSVSAWRPERKGADACAVAALKAKRPFLLRYGTYTNNEIRDAVLVGTPKGEVYFLTSSEYCCSGAQVIAYEYLCKHPIVVMKGTHKRIACHEKRNLTP